ncbi:MAG TPA: hypothetical protein VGE40_08970 [Bacilli bacterium]
MKWIVRIIAASCISIVLAMLLSFLPQLDVLEQWQNRNISVFNNTKLPQLSNQNLVDHLINIPLHVHVSKVEWNNHDLSLDLSTPINLGHHAVIFGDLRELIDFSLLETSNVKRVFIRLLATDEASGKKQLLIAAEARREDLTLKELRRVKKDKPTAENYLNSEFSMTYTKLWNNTIYDR